MIDFTKIRIHDQNSEQLIEKLKANNWHDLECRFDDNTGEVLQFPLIPKLNNLEMHINGPNYCQLEGSLHKFFEGENNIKSFSYRNLLDTIIFLYDTIRLDPFTSTIHHIEFGFNLKVSFDRKEFIHRIMNYKGENFTVMRKQDGVSLGKFCDKTQYEIKIYSKKNCNVLRIEIKVKRMQCLKNEKLIHLIDLLNPLIWKALSTRLKAIFEQIVIFDKTIDVSKLKPKEKVLYTNWGNPQYLIERYEANSKAFQKERVKYWAICKNYTKRDEKPEIMKLIDEEFEKLLSINDQTFEMYTEFINRIKKDHSYPIFRREEWYNLSQNENDLNFIPAFLRNINVPDPITENMVHPKIINCQEQINYYTSTTLSEAVSNIVDLDLISLVQAANDSNNRIVEMESKKNTYHKLYSWHRLVAHIQLEELRIEFTVFFKKVKLILPGFRFYFDLLNDEIADNTAGNIYPSERLNFIENFALKLPLLVLDYYRFVSNINQFLHLKKINK